jgi:LacI family transcriptional regulator
MSSIKEVAREAGVSTATVSHVINNTRYVSDEVRARVEKAIEQCRYYPNAHARSLASGKSKIIGLVISDIVNPFFPELVKAIEAAAFERGYDIMLSNTNYDTGRTSHYVRRFIERKIAGVAVMTSEMDKKLVDELAQREVPVVFLDVGEPGLHMSNLRVDYDEGIEQAILHLVALGHRRIAFIGGNTNLRSSRRRLEAFRKTMQQLFPVAPELVFYGNFKIEGGQRAASEILAMQGANLPTAVVCANDLTAIGAISEFEAAGLNVPRDISVVGFDNIAFAALKFGFRRI